MRVMALIKRIIKQFLYDRRTLGLILLAPLLLLTLINQMLAGEAHSPIIAALHVPASINKILINAGANVETHLDGVAAHSALINGEIDAILDMSADSPILTLEGSNPTVSGATIRLVNTVLQKAITGQPPVEVAVSFIYGKENMPLFDFGGPILVAFLSFFFVFITAGVSFLRERSAGTLERLMGTPIKPWELVTGYICGFGIFVFIQATMISIFAVEVLNVLLFGQLSLMILVTMLGAVSALTLGMLLSSLAQNEFQIVQLIPVVIVPQILFTGLFNLDAFPFWLRFIGYLMPVQYGVNALNQIMIRGKSLEYVTVEIAALIGFSAVFSIGSIFLLKRRA